MKLVPSLALAAFAASPTSAQHLCEGNGFGEAYVEVGPAYLGGRFVNDVGSPNVPNGICFFSISGGFQETVHPLVGPICLDVFSPFYDVIALPTGPDGNLHFELYLPDIPTWVGNPPFYSNVATFEGGISISKTVPLWFENPASWTPTGPMSAARMYHTATYLGADGRDDRIRLLVAGGCVGAIAVPQAPVRTTEVFDPLGRTFSPGPDLSVERAAHSATRLQDGRVLIAGGFGLNGVGHATAELFDLTTGTITPTGSMSVPRLGHTATLLADGRVLVAGGFAHYENVDTAWNVALESAWNTAEIYDPATGAWTPLAQTMGSKRSGHTATTLPDGRVLIVGGISGAMTHPLAGNLVPAFTGSCDFFDPATDSILPAPGIDPGRAFHGASVLGNGHVLVTGGTLTGGPYDEAVSTKACLRFDGTTWNAASPLPVEVAYHVQVALDDGRALVSGGLDVSEFTLAAKAFTGTHDGFATVLPATGIGLNEGIPGSVPLLRGAMKAARMHDGAFLFTGGTDGFAVVNEAFVYTPPF